MAEPQVLLQVVLAGTEKTTVHFLCTAKAYFYKICMKLDEL